MDELLISCAYTMCDATRRDLKSWANDIKQGVFTNRARDAIEKVEYSAKYRQLMKHMANNLR